MRVQVSALQAAQGAGWQREAALTGLLGALAVAVLPHWGDGPAAGRFRCLHHILHQTWSQAPSAGTTDFYLRG